MWIQAIEHLGDLGNRENVKLAAERDQGCSTVRTRLDNELLCGEHLP